MEMVTANMAMDSLHGNLGSLCEIVQGGWDDYINEYPPSLRVVHTSTTRAGIVHDHQIVRASEYADTDRKIRLEDISRMKLLVIESNNRFYAIRIKKFDGALKSVNLLTRQVKDFRGQNQLAGLPVTHNLEIGYVLDRSESFVAGIWMTHPSGPLSNYWEIDLMNIAANRKSNIQDLFVPPVQSDIADKDEVEVRPKSTGVVVSIRSDDEHED